ncbi:MAG: FAD-dependent oxidoreductase, partial [Lachnospiraceae bacterium]|nr:FAD-dependent oxidoreductase [Lachnospiraceae bacterium]
FLAGMERFSGKIPDFNREDAILSGVESRTSSPVRILRGNQLQSSIAGLYPCGEGAGYAGGIMSAAMDGIKVAEAVAGRYAPMEKDEKWIRIQ